MKPKLRPWHEIVALRDDLRSGTLTLSAFAADLYDVVAQKGHRPVYEKPEEFFALTYPTYNLRGLAKDVATRLAGKGDKAYRLLAVTYGGGKTHTLITLKHLFHDPAHLPDLPTVREFLAHIEIELPKARIAALCFDKIDSEKGMETLAPDGSSRFLVHPWSILAYQLAGEDGLKYLHPDGKGEERESPPAEPILAHLLSKPQEDGLATLVLLDEVLMYVRPKIEADPSWRGRLTSFFQCLSQATVKVDRCSMVVSLLASDPARHDDFGKQLLAEISEIFGRQGEEHASPVSKEDVAEVLRRRFFKVDSIHDLAAFRPNVTTIVGNLVALNEQVKKDQRIMEEQYLASFPFHPALTEAFYTRWTQLDKFQRTRGILRTFALALRQAEKWDKCPLICSTVFLRAPEEFGLSEAISELCNVASVEVTEGSGHQWMPILEGEIKTAQKIQYDATHLQHREVEQAVVSVFLNSQPIGQKISTNDLLLQIGTQRSDKIELEKALKRWTELSWFLDEGEIGSGGANLSDAGLLPKAWRLGNRPNLRQMHHAACSSRISPDQVKDYFRSSALRTTALFQSASSAGAKVHKMPASPGDIQDDGSFHFAILAPDAASAPGNPSAVAKQFIEETTSSDRPRVYRNAIVLAVPSRDGLEVAYARVREYLGWVDVKDQLRNQTIDETRKILLDRNIHDVEKSIPTAIRQAYNIAVTIDEHEKIIAVKIGVTGDSLFSAIKADKQIRIQESAISSEALMPGGPYDLWKKEEKSYRIKSLVDAFAQHPRLPKMLRRKDILNTIVKGVETGIWVARITRPDKSVKTFWRTEIDEVALNEPGLEVALTETATVTELDPVLLAPQQLPGLWSSGTISVKNVYDYFSKGHTESVPRDGYNDQVGIPACTNDIVKSSISEAIENGILWLTYGQASILGEPVPEGVLTQAAQLQSPPRPIEFSELMKESIPDAWEENKTSAYAILTALSNQQNRNLPWAVVSETIDGALKARWLELADEATEWPCDVANAKRARLQIPEKRVASNMGKEEDTKPKEAQGCEAGDFGRDDDTNEIAGMRTDEVDLFSDNIQELAEQIPELTKAVVEHDLKFRLSIELEGSNPPDSGALNRVNALLAKVSDKLKLKKAK